jgi:hypothetical protein
VALTPRRWGRAAILFAGAIWLVVLPVYAQVSGHRLVGVREWHMYSGVATDICEVSYWAYEDGRPAYQVDRLGVLARSGRSITNDVRFLRNPNAIDAQARLLCRALGASDVRAIARCGSRTTWQQVHLREASLCQSGATP